MRVNVCNYTTAPPPDSVLLPMDSRSCVSWHRRLSPALLGPVTMWDGTKATNLHNALLSTVYNGNDPADVVQGRADMLWRTSAVVGKWHQAREYYWDGYAIGPVDWRIHVLGPLVVEAFETAPDLLARLQQACDGYYGLCLHDADASNWSCRSSLPDAIHNRKKSITHSHILAGLLLGDPILEDLVPL